jgi:hypothetical protein
MSRQLWVGLAVVLVPPQPGCEVEVGGMYGIELGTPAVSVELGMPGRLDVLPLVG